MFYKLINENEIKKAPNPLIIDGAAVFTNREEIFNEQGYYRLISAEYPQDEKFYFPKYRQEGNVIVQEWFEGGVDLDDTN